MKRSAHAATTRTYGNQLAVWRATFQCVSPSQTGWVKSICVLFTAFRQVGLYASRRGVKLWTSIDFCGLNNDLCSFLLYFQTEIGIKMSQNYRSDRIEVPKLNLRSQYLLCLYSIGNNSQMAVKPWFDSLNKMLQ